MKNLQSAVFQLPTAVAGAAVFTPTQAQKFLLTCHVTPETAKGEDYDNARN